MLIKVGDGGSNHLASIRPNCLTDSVRVSLSSLVDQRKKFLLDRQGINGVFFSPTARAARSGDRGRSWGIVDDRGQSRGIVGDRGWTNKD